MDSFLALGNGFLVALEPSNLLFATIGVLLGTLVGVLPGIGPALTVALLLPVTFKLDPGGSIIMFAGIYYGGMYGGSSPLRGLTSLAFGLLLGLMGIDQLTGQARMTFGVPQLLDGIEVTTLAVSLFAIGEALFVASRHLHNPEKPIPIKGSLWMTRQDWKRSWRPWLRGVGFGFPIGALPAGGAEIPTVLSYATERKLSKHPEEFGTGAIEGVAGPEAANNASAAGTLVPLLTLGLPTSATAAIMLAGLQQYGLQPGPLLFANSPDLVWGLIASLFIANLVLVILNLPLIGLWVRLLAIPMPWLYVGILVFAANPSAVVLGLLVIVGFFMRRHDYPVAPAVVGLILGPMADAQLRHSLQMSLGDPMILLENPGSATLPGIAALALLAPFVLKGLERFQMQED